MPEARFTRISVAFRIALAMPALLFVSSTFATTEIRTAAQEASEPKFVVIDQNGKPAIGGLCVDIMRAIERIDPSLRFVGDQVWQPRTRIEANLKFGALDAICGVQRTRVREPLYKFVDKPLFSVSYFLVVRADDGVQIESWNDVRRLRSDNIILAIHGFGIVDRLREFGGLRIDDSAKSSAENLQKLMARRGRFYLHREPSIAADIRKAGLDANVKVLPTVMDTEAFYMAVAKTMPAGEVEKIGKAIAALDQAGELTKLFEKWSKN